MSRPSRERMAQEVADFAVKMTPEAARWEYAMSVATYLNSHGQRQYDGKAARAVGRFLGYDQGSMALRLMRISLHGGLEGARAHFQTRAYWQDGNPFKVCAIEPYQIGHVYFARLRQFPHVMKVGFSRRVHSRIDEIESKSRQTVGDVTVEVGTMADEHRFHRLWKDNCISGEWFYAPNMDERSLPPFLAETKAEAA
jgi:hypothetical protein